MPRPASRTLPQTPGGGADAAWFDMAFGASPNGVLLLDLEGRVLRANASFVELAGYSQEELHRRPREVFFTPEHQASEAALLAERVLLHGASEECEKEYIRRDGTLLRVWARLWPVRDPQGQPLGALEMLQPPRPAIPSDAWFLKNLVDTIPCPLFFKDAAGHFLGCNRAFETFLGKSREEIIGRTVHEIAPKDLADIYCQQDQALFLTRGVQIYDTQVASADGHRCDVVYYKAALEDAQGQATGLVGVMLDITGRKRVEQHLRGALELNQKLLTASPIGIGVFNAVTGRCVAANESLARIVGGTVDQLLLQNFRELDSWQASGMLEAAERAIASGEEQHLQIDMTSTFGKRYWISVVFASFFSGDEKHLLMLHDDITEQQAAKEALQYSEEKYRTLADKLGEGLAMADLSYHYTYCNPRLLQILGREEHEVLGKCLQDFVAETAREALLEKQEEHRHGPIKLFETQLCRKDGSTVDVLLSVSHLRSDQGEFLGSLELITDISQMKMYQDALQEAQLQIIQHEKMAALGTMVAGVAHEINNPTHFAQLGAKSLERGMARFKRELHDLISEDDPEVLAYLGRHFTAFDASLRRILEGCTRIRNIVQDLRLFARIGECGTREVAIAEGLEMALQLAKVKHPGIRFVTDFISQGRILCSPAELNQAFLNILDNACRAIEDRKKEADPGFRGRIKVALQESEPGVQVTIADNGCGMSASVKARMFEPFFTTRPLGHGAGLGLAVAFQVVEDHGGRIDVNSHPNEGTSVTVFLPFKR